MFPTGVGRVEGDQRKGSFWTSLPGVLTAIAGIITGTAAIVSAIVALGGGPTPTPTPTPTTTTPAPTPTPTPETATIEVVYRGDPYGCSLLVQVEIADVTATQQGLRQTIRDLPVGLQDYRISGQITCPTLGNCKATGDGKVMVQEGREYALIWLNTDIAECNVSLEQ
jgi:hypothetical protein